MIGRNRYIAASVLFWLLTGTVFWWFLETLKTGCQIQERESGLAAECFAPAGLVFSLAFVVLLLVDVIRIVLAFSMRRSSKLRGTGELEHSE